MLSSFEAFVGLRYVRAKRRDHFISFISCTSVLGVALGVMALIVVLSVMNGFEKELKERILGMASHATIERLDRPFTDWRSVMTMIRQHPEVVGVAPFFRSEGMLVNGRHVQGSVVRAILPEYEGEVSELADKIQSGTLDSLQAGAFRIILGAEMARALGVKVGDSVTLLTPQANMTLAGILPRLKRFSVAAIFEVGMHEFDSALSLIHLEDANVLFRRTGPGALRIKTTDLLRAPAISRAIQGQLAGRYWVVDWTERHANFFRALRIEKTVMFIILALIVSVAAFNIISTLVMVVADKESDIAILRTLGASPGDILRIFIVQGTVIGLVGIGLGIIFGVVIALNVETLISMLEGFFDTKLLSPDIYYISDLPSDLRWKDVFIVVMMSFILCVGATLYPALRAARVQPAEALRYE